MKKSFSVFLILSIIAFLVCVSFASTPVSGSFSVWDGTTVKSIATGSGTEADPYIITNAAELDYIATVCMSGESFAGKFIKLGVNINWGGREWTSIGYSTTTVFSGNFDGNGKTIFNLTCKDVTAGIFAYATNATIKNLNIDYATFITDTRYAGAIVGLMRSSIVSGCSAGENVKIMTTDTMSNTAQIGGLFGLVNSSFVDNCTFKGEVIATSITGTSFIGGIAGVIGNNSEVGYCVNYGSVSVSNACLTSGNYAFAGGITGGIGSSSAVGSISYCINKGDVTAVEYAGGVLGRVHVAESTMSNCYNIGNVSSTSGFAGALAGEIPSAGKISDCYGITSVGTTAAYAKLGDSVTLPSGALMLGTEIEISELEGFKKIMNSISINIPAFDRVSPETLAETTTAPVVTTGTQEETTVVTDTTNAAIVTTTVPGTTEAATTEAVGTTAALSVTAAAPGKSGGCGGTLAGGTLIFTVITVGTAVFVKRKTKNE